MTRGCFGNAHADFRNMADEDVIAYARAGDNLAAEHLLSKYRCIAESKARTYFLVGADRDDVIQEGMIGLFKAIRDYRSDKPAGFRVFAEICVTRQIISAVKSATRQKHVPLNRGISLHYAASGYEPSSVLIDILPNGCVIDPEKILLESDVMERLDSAAQKHLSSLEAKVLRCYMQGMSYWEMSRLLSCCAKSIDNALQRAKRKIWHELNQD